MIIRFLLIDVPQQKGPFLLRHVYQQETDDHAGGGVFESLFNQFSEPKRRDAAIDRSYTDIGER